MVRVIKHQYKGINLKNVQINNIDSLLKDNTFTITTGHQLNLLTGPLYFIYKIISVINLSESLNKKYKKYNFVPIYWMASEDHDFKEINNFSVQGKKFEWDSDQTGMVGDFKLNTELSFILLFLIKNLKNDLRAEIFLAIELEEISEFLL